MPQIHATVKVDDSKVNDALKKAERLNALLKEANSLARELASSEIVLKVDVEM